MAWRGKLKAKNLAWGWRGLGVFLLLGLLATGCSRPGGEKGADEGAGPELVPATGAQLLARVRSSPAEVVLVNVWATWCIPCREEFPALMRLRREMSAEAMDLVLVSADFPDQLAAARAFLAEQGVTFVSFYKDEADEAFINALSERWSGALPATFVFDKERKLARFWEGGASFDEFLAAVPSAAAWGKG